MRSIFREVKYTIKGEPSDDVQKIRMLAIAEACREMHGWAVNSSSVEHPLEGETMWKVELRMEKFVR